MAEISYFRRMVVGVPVVAAPAEIDITTAEQLDAVLLATVGRGHMTVVVDMTQTRFCDCRALHTLLRAHERMAADGGQLRLAMPAVGAAPRVVSLTGLDHLIPCLGSLEEAPEGYRLSRQADKRHPRGQPRQPWSTPSPRIAQSGIYLSTAQNMGLP